MTRARAHPFPETRLAGSVLSLGFDRDGRYLVCVDNKGTGELRDMATGEQIVTFGGAELVEKGSGLYLGGVMALGADGALFASQSGRSATVWDLQTTEMLAALPDESGTTWALAFSPDSELLAVGSSNGGLALWNLHKIRARLAEIGLGW